VTIPGGPWSRRRVVVVALVGLVAVALSVARGLHEHVGGDFHVFWQAGRNFFTGAPLYHGDLPGARNFIYPPFAALVFGVFALLPLQVAATIFSLLNMALWVVATWLTRDIVARTFPDRNPAGAPLAVAVVFTAQFFLNNFNLVQVNEVIFVLVLLGIRAALDARDAEAALWFVGATALKITPVFFVIWLLLRGRRRAFVTVPPAALACLLVPLLVRGPATGSAELREYYHSFLESRQHGQVGTGDQNLGGMVYRMLRPTTNPEQLNYQLLSASEQTAALVYRGSVAVLLVTLLGSLVVLRQRSAPITAFELSSVFLASLLLSPITRKAHLVTLLFVAYSFLAIRRATLPRPGRVALVGLWALMAVSGVTGRDLFGRTVYYYIGGYSVIVWTMLLLFAASVVLSHRRLAVARSWHE
jgi:glycosyl transferase family 87